MTKSTAPSIAIACGGTGGHLFPGLAVAGQLLKRGCAVTLLVSPKEVDQQAVKAALERRAPAHGEDAERIDRVAGAPMEVVTLPAVGLQNRNYFSFGVSFLKAWLAARRAFRHHKPSAALAMGGFTSAPPIFAAKQLGAKTFLHESNTIPGRANRWLSRSVDQCFVGFPQAAARLRNQSVTVTGTPVRPEFHLRPAAACRTALGLDPDRPTILVMGGSQGASGINDLMMRALPLLAGREPQPQFLHLSGPGDADKLRRAYAEKKVRAVVHAFFGEMELALGAASVAISRSGASSLAELAAMQVPSVLVPFPAATDNHQFFNGRAFESTGAACMLEQKNAAPESMARLILELVENDAARRQMQTALAKWHAPQAAEQIAETMLKLIAQETEPARATPPAAQGGRGEHRAEWRAKTTA
jgi:UDP-N-acetylglucosamine--N-acetylmuramyl-(pentapeptide) pyrophosphoryl-undecaprenol N-acetylglucosamine transferase